MKKLYSARQIHESRAIYWVKSYKTLLRYLKEYEHILKPIRTGSQSGRRYYITERSLKKFVQMFENNELA